MVKSALTASKAIKIARNNVEIHKSGEFFRVDTYGLPGRNTRDHSQAIRQASTAIVRIALTLLGEHDEAELVRQDEPGDIWERVVYADRYSEH